MLTHESEQFLNSFSVQHVSLHVCKNFFEPEILETAVHYNQTLTTPNFEGTIIPKTGTTMKTQSSWYNTKEYDTGYPHDGRADNAAYRHDRRADKRRYPHDREIDIQMLKMFRNGYILSW